MDYFEIKNGEALKNLQYIFSNAYGETVYRTVDVTPDLAKRILNELNYNNRSISQSTVNKYAERMKNGSFKMNGESIKFDKNFRLVDGQHRLSAIVKSQKTIRMDFCLLMNYELGEEILVMDCGKARRTVDFVQMGGYPTWMRNKRMISILNDFYSRYVCDKVSKDGARRTLPLDQLVEYELKNEEICKFIISMITKRNSKSKLSKDLPAYIGGSLLLAYLCGENDDAIYDFCRCYCSNVTSEKRNNKAALDLKERMSRDLSRNNTEEVQTAIYAFIHNKKRLQTQIYYHFDETMWLPKKFVWQKGENPHEQIQI